MNFIRFKWLKGIEEEQSHWLKFILRRVILLVDKVAGVISLVYIQITTYHLLMLPFHEKIFQQVIQFTNGLTYVKWHFNDLIGTCSCIHVRVYAVPQISFFPPSFLYLLLTLLQSRDFILAQIPIKLVEFVSLTFYWA